jgi:L-threonylcarbamoyladenylate synthase
MKIIDYDPPFAKLLRDAFLPGPLTLVYPSKNKVSPYVSCGLDTLAVRVPSHEGAQAFLKEVDIPIVAPSANLSKHVSPTSAKHVFDDFNGLIPLILDGGECEGGIESTVCDVTGEYPVILRPGLITKEMIEEVCGICGVYAPTLKAGDKAKSPGMMYKHYSPRCKTQLYSSKDIDVVKLVAEQERLKGNRVVILCERKWKETFEINGLTVLDLGETEQEMAANLYGLLRCAEEIADLLIAVAPDKQDGIMAGVMNRLNKACLSQDIQK